MKSLWQCISASPEVIHLVYLIKRILQTEAAISKTDLFFKLASLDTIQAVVFILSDLLQFSSNCLDRVAVDYYKFKCQIQLDRRLEALL